MNDLPQNEGVASENEDYRLVRRLLVGRAAFFIYGAILSGLFLFPDRYEDKLAMDTCKTALKEKTDQINALIADFRSDAISREKALASQRDTFIEMIREHLMRLKTQEPTIVHRYRSSNESKDQSTGKGQ